MMKRGIVAALAGLVAVIATPSLAVNDAALMAAKPAPYLSTYDLFSDLPRLTPAAGVTPYDLTNPLFTDYAAKYRFVYVPEGQTAQYQQDEAFDFPVGSVLIKNFAYPADFRQPDENVRLIETRLLIHQQDGWVALPYVWNAEQTDAKLKRAGARMDLSWIDEAGNQQGTRYVVPNMNQCKGCHIYNKEMTPIGPKARNLNRDYSYADGSTKNQLAHWVAIGLLPEDTDLSKASWLPRVDDPRSGTVAERARAYLDINCAHCHREGGPGDTSGLFLLYDENRPAHWGYKKRPVAAGRGSGGLEFDIAPGKPDESIIVYRMNSVDPGIAMPELGRTMIHEEGLALIREWIGSMDD